MDRHHSRWVIEWVESMWVTDIYPAGMFLVLFSDNLGTLRRTVKCIVVSKFFPEEWRNFRSSTAMSLLLGIVLSINLSPWTRTRDEHNAWYCSAPRNREIVHSSC